MKKNILIIISLAILDIVVLIYLVTVNANTPYKGGFQYEFSAHKSNKDVIRESLIHAKDYFTDQEIDDLLEISEINKLENGFEIGPTIKELRK